MAPAISQVITQPPGLPAVDRTFGADEPTIYYNRVLWNRTASIKINGRPVKDPTGRTPSYMDWDIQVVGTICYPPGDPSAGTEDEMEELRRRLSEQGGELVIRGTGFGDLICNSSILPERKDVAWGPEVTKIGWAPGAGNITGMIEWHCTVRIPECDSARYAGVLMSVSYENTWDIVDGWTVLTIRGELQIPLTRKKVTDKVLTDWADNYRAKIKPACPFGFLPKRQHFGQNAAKNGLEFEFIFEQQRGEPFPDGLAGADVKESLRYIEGKARYRNFLYRLSGSVTLPPGAKHEMGWFKICLIIQDRLTKAIGRGAFRTLFSGPGLTPLFGKTPTTKTPEKPLLMGKDFEIGNEIYGNKLDFACSWQILGATLAQVLSASGMFTPIAGTSYATWKDSVKDTVFHERGGARLLHKPGPIVDLCNQPDPNEVTIGRVVAGVPAKPGVLGVDFAQPDPEASWVYYEISLHYEEINGIVQMTPLPTVGAVVAAPGYDPTGVASLVGTLAGGNVFAGVVQAAAVQSILQNRGCVRCKVSLVGRACRVYYPIKTPGLLSIGGAIAKQTSQFVIENKVLDTRGGMVIYGSSWNRKYVLDLPPATFPILSDPQVKVDGKK